MISVLETLRQAIKSSPYEGRVYLVGGIVRDKILGRELDEDVDLVIEGDAAELAAFLSDSGVAEREPVTYPRFGTAMVIVDGRQVELVGARKESYDPTSRKPSTSPGTLLDDVLRRDFTINTLLENLETGEMLDLTGQGLSDLRDGIIRTPRDPHITFDDDPLRMMRAIRFAARFGFTISPETMTGLRDKAPRMEIVSAERIKEELVKILMSPRPVEALEAMRETGLLDSFAPELSAMNGVTQNIYHLYDVWGHTLKTLESISANSGITLRLAALLHDVGKPQTRSIDEHGNVHFYRHQAVSASISRKILQRLKFPNSQIAEISFLISMHLRVGEYDNGWSDSAVRRLVRDVGKHLDDLVVLTQADKDASNPEMPRVDLDAFWAHVNRIKHELAGHKIESPLDGREITELLEIEPGPRVGDIKTHLESQIIDGSLLPGDKAAAAEIVLETFGKG